MLELVRPLISTDLETTGINSSSDRIIQIGIVKLLPSGERKEWQTLVNPGVPIPAEASGVHKITDDMVKDAPSFKALAPTLERGFKDADFCGYNIKAFDLPFLQAEFTRAGITFDYSASYVVDGFKIYLSKSPRNLLSAVRDFLGDQRAKEFEGQAHDALCDARASLDVVIAQLKRYEDIPRTPAGIHSLLFSPKGNNIDSEGKFHFINNEAVMNFGKYRGALLRDVCRQNADYLKWVLSANFSPETKKILRDALDGNFPKPRA